MIKVTVSLANAIHFSAKELDVVIIDADLKATIEAELVE